MSDNTRAVELLPCPFCGEEAQRGKARFDSGWAADYIECSGCGANTCPATWNTRAALTSPPPPSELREALEDAAVRLDICADMIAGSFSASGTLRAERTLIARRYANDARAALRTAPIEPRPAELREVALRLVDKARKYRLDEGDLWELENAALQSAPEGEKP